MSETPKSTHNKGSHLISHQGRIEPVTCALGLTDTDMQFIIGMLIARNTCPYHNLGGTQIR